MLIGGIYVTNDDVTGAASGCTQRAIDGAADSELVDRATVSTSSVAIGGTFTSASETYMVIAAAFAQPGGAPPVTSVRLGTFSLLAFPKTWFSGTATGEGWFADVDVPNPALEEDGAASFSVGSAMLASAANLVAMAAGGGGYGEDLPHAPAAALEDGYGPGIGPTVVAYAAPQVQLGTQGVEDIFAPSP